MAKKAQPKTSNHPGYSRLWYDKINTNVNPSWMGVVIVKHPNDLFAYQEILYATKPELIIETGTFAGGSALYLAHLLDILYGDDPRAWLPPEKGRVLSIDLATDRPLPDHPRIDYLLGMSSTDPVVLSHVDKHADGKRCMVILDSAHGADHVLREMYAYEGYVAKGCYLIVEDGNRDGYFLGPGDIVNNEGPAEAIKRFQPRNRGFIAAPAPERFGFTQNCGGYLRRVR